MFTYLNGEIALESEAVVPVTDRGFMYGDGLFESIRVHKGLKLRWFAHMARLQQGLELLEIPFNFDPRQLQEAARELIERNELTDAVLRVQITRGSGKRGYSPRGAEHPTIVITSHPAPPLAEEPPRWKLKESTIRIHSNNPLNSIKSLNKLPNIMAKAEAERDGFDDAIMLNERDEVVEASCANLFWIRDGVVRTPPDESGALPGITRNFIMDLAAMGEVELQESATTMDDLRTAEGIFLSMSSRVMVEVEAVDEAPIPQSPVFGRLREGFLYFLNKGQGLS